MTADVAVAPPSRLRVVVHALDRTGPPVLARTLVEWLTVAHPATRVDLIAFRGGPLRDEMPAPVAVTVVLDDHEPWPAVEGSSRPDALRTRLTDLPAVDVTLLISVAAGQVLPLLGPAGHVVCWSVEVAEDLHWVDGDLGLRERTDRWLAGSEATAGELAALLDGARPTVVPEFVAPARPPDDALRAEVRARCGAGPDDLLVLGAGIGTRRKGLDLFVEVAQQHHLAGGRCVFTWVGGEDDPLHCLVAAQVRDLGLDRVTLLPSVPDLGPWFDAADVLLHPARADAFPLVCLHAALAGAPVVAFGGVGGVEEMFGPAFVGAPYPDVAGLETRLIEMGHPDHRAAVARAQAERVAARHVVDGAAPALIAALAAGTSPTGPAS